MSIILIKNKWLIAYFWNGKSCIRIVSQIACEMQMSKKPAERNIEMKHPKMINEKKGE